MKFNIPIIKKLKKKKSARPTWNEAHTTRYKELVAQLEGLGFVVRREELKRGHCWKALSGACRSLSQNFVFIDSRLTPDEQIAFLSAKVVEVQGEPPLAEAVAVAG